MSGAALIIATAAIEEEAAEARADQARQSLAVVRQAVAAL